MTFHNPPTEQQGIYRYDPTSIKTGGRDFPKWEKMESGVIVRKMRDNLVDKGKVSEPLIQLLENITATELQAGRYVVSPKALFYRDQSGLEPDP